MKSFVAIVAAMSIAQAQLLNSSGALGTGGGERDGILTLGQSWVKRGPKLTGNLAAIQIGSITFQPRLTMGIILRPPMNYLNCLCPVEL